MKRFIFAFLLSIVTVVSYSVPAYAATETETLDGLGTVLLSTSLNTNTYVGGADYTVLNSNDDATSYIQTARCWSGSGGWATQSATYTTTAFTSAYSVINSVTATSRMYLHNGSASNGNVSYYRGGTNYGGTTVSISDDTWTTVSHTWTTCPATGVAWTPTDINNYEFGFNFSIRDGCGADYSRISYLSVSTDYTAPLTPTVTTQAVSAITPTAATGNGNVTSDGGGTITSRGTVIAVAANPTTADHQDAAIPVGTTGAFTTSITALTKGTLYHVRAFATNVTGTSYGVDESFTTIGDPTISTSAASLVTSTTARINGQVSFDGAVGGGEPCTVTLVYFAGTGYADYAAILAAGGTEVVAAGTYIVGSQPYYDISGLVITTSYSYSVKIINSTAVTAYGGIETFTTTSGISDSASMTAIPTATTISLAWVKGAGSQYTLVRYSPSNNPTSIADGTLAYLGTGNSYTLTGLTPGTTYYFSAWGKTGALYSAGYVTTLATTLAYDTAVSTGTLETPPSNSWWNQTPSAAKVGSIPVVSALVTQSATVYAIPEASLWYFLWVLFSVGMGVIIYIKAGMNLVAGLGSQALLFALGAVLGLTMLWIMVIFMVIGVGFTLWGNRH
jgi:hypothetical protein